MEFELYLPCQPKWLCGPLLLLFAILVGVGILLFIGLIIKEYRRIQHVQSVLKRRRQHYTQREKMNRYYSRPSWRKKK